MDKPETGIGRKSSKTQAILLAVLFGPWTWLHTYHKNKWKFWGSFILILAALIITVTTSLSSPTSSLLDAGIYTLFPLTIFLVFHDVISGVISFCVVAFSTLLIATEPMGLRFDFNLIYVFLILAAVWVWAVIDTSIKPKIKYESEPAEISKKLALITAIVFSYNAWLYTYHKDAWKFWASFGTFNLVVPLAVGIMNSCRPVPEAGEYVDGTGALIMTIGTIISLGAAIILVTWLLAIIDNRPGSNKWKNFEPPAQQEDNPPK
jgi:hypothetical protein